MRLIADENIPFRIIEKLRKVGHDVLTVTDVARPGIGNSELAEISARLDGVIMTRDADFTRLTRPLLKRVKVIYVNLSGDPNGMAQLVLDCMKECDSILQRHNVVVLDDEGCHAL